MAEDEEDTIDGGEEDVEVEGVELLPSSEVLRLAIELIEEYKDEDVVLGLRALYYQFVGRNLVSPEELAITNGKGKTVGAHRFYKRLGRICAEARYDGIIPMDALADEGRDVEEGDFTREDLDVDAAHEGAGEWIRNLHNMLMQTDRWVGQKYFVSVWVEKIGLNPIVLPICKELGVGYLACRGYPSVTALGAWLKAAHFACNGGESTKDFTYGKGLDLSERHIGGLAREAVILYYGDHDPDGFEIPRSSERGIRRLMATYDMDVPLRFERRALSIAQVRKYDLPPFEAKMTSARFKGYRKEHGITDAWEIDALDMRVLRDMVRKDINDLWDDDIGRVRQRDARARSRELRERIVDPEWLSQVFDNE